MAPANKTQYAILGVLSMIPGSSGYDIKKFCDQTIAHFWRENYGHIYPVLKRLETEGLIRGETERTAGNPPRNIYFVTERGRRALEDWLAATLEKQPPPRMELLLKLFFGGFMPFGQVIAMIEESRQHYLELIETYVEIERKTLAEKGRPEDEYLFQLATVRFGLSNARAGLQWCDETLEILRRHGQKRSDTDK